MTYQRGERLSGEISEEGFEEGPSTSAGVGGVGRAGGRSGSSSSSHAAAAAAAAGQGLSLSAVQQMCREKCCPFCSSMFETEDDVQV